MGMLVLSRKQNESIVIGDGKDMIRITVIGLRNGQVKLGVDAPKNVPVLREELTRNPPPSDKKE